MECNLCGKDYQKLNKANIEGTVLEVCDNCVKFGIKIPERVSYAPVKRKIAINALAADDLVLTSGYGQLIKNTREARKLLRKDFASKISEKESVIKRIEEEFMEPDERLARKIENSLDIKLFEKYEREHVHKKSKKHGEMTVGDVVEIV